MRKLGIVEITILRRSRAAKRSTPQTLHGKPSERCAGVVWLVFGVIAQAANCASQTLNYPAWPQIRRTGFDGFSGF